MALRIYRSGRLSRVHEVDQMNALLAYFEQEFENRNEEVIVIIEPSIPTSSDGSTPPQIPDALIVKDNVFVLIELKAYDGDIIADCSRGANWRQKDGKEFDPERGYNPFSQARNHRRAFLDFLSVFVIGDRDIPPYVKRDDHSLARWMDPYVMSWVVTGEGSLPTVVGVDVKTVPYFKVLPVEDVIQSLPRYYSSAPLVHQSGMQRILDIFSAQHTTRSEWFRGEVGENQTDIKVLIPRITHLVNSGRYDDVRKALDSIQELELVSHHNQLLKVWRESPYPDLRLRVLKMLIQWKVGRIGGILDEALRDPDPGIVSFTIDHLSRYEYGEPIGTLSEMLKQESNQSQIGVIKALAATGSETAGQAVLDFFRKNFGGMPFKEYQYWADKAHEVFEREKKEERYEQYEEFAKSDQKRMLLLNLARASIDAFSALSCYDSIPLLRKIVNDPLSLGFESNDYSKLFDIHSDFYSVFPAACKSLGNLSRGDKNVEDLLANTLSSVPEDYQDCVIRALADLGDPKAAKPLMAFLNSQLDFLRIEAIRGLGEIRAQEALGPLRALYVESYEKGEDEFDPEIQAIAEALLKIDRSGYEMTLLQMIRSPVKSEPQKMRRGWLFRKLNPIVTFRSEEAMLRLVDDDEVGQEAAVTLSLINSKEVVNKGWELARSDDANRRFLGLQVLYNHFKVHQDDLAPFESDSSSGVRELVASYYLEFGEIGKLVKFSKDSEYDVRRIVYFGLRKKSKTEVMKCQFVSVGCRSGLAEILVSDLGLVSETKDNLLVIPYNAITRIAAVHGRNHKIAIYFETNDESVGCGVIAMILHEFDYESSRDYETDVLFKAIQTKAKLDFTHSTDLRTEEVGRFREVLGDAGLQIGTKIPISLEELS